MEARTSGSSRTLDFKIRKAGNRITQHSMSNNITMADIKRARRTEAERKSEWEKESERERRKE